MGEQTISLEQYKQLVGQQIGTSRWLDVDQPRVDRFAEVTEDEQFIHVDPEAASKTAFGGTIGHGFLILSLLSAMYHSAVPALAGREMGINYGLNSVRFVHPVLTGKRVRGVFVLKDFCERRPGQWQSTFGVTVELEGNDKPALVAEWVTLAIVPQSAAA